MPYNSGEALLEQVTALPLIHITGDLASGFAWPPVPGAHPRRSYAVSPLAAPSWPASGRMAGVLIELWWATDPVSMERKVLSCWGLFDDVFDAYLAACCLWGRADTGRGAVAAVLYGPDQIPHLIERAASTCSRLPVSLVDRLVAACAVRFTTDEPPAVASGDLQIFGGGLDD